ncbi:hypothetical protein [Bacillus atrophaeus]|uniref:hypothetical protein n=1 Tax=Bacillus atrophaeus TaxID=1452 RepID=UPI0021637D09|nr:hypothetical protein [Bacillus atrophaeus]
MRNKAADRLVLTGVILHIIQWFSVLWAFLKIENSFGHFTIYNPNVINGSMQSFSFMQMMRSMVYSGAMVNYVLFFMFAFLIFYLSLNAVFIVLEIAAYVMIRRNPYSSWAYFITAMGVKLASMNITGILFLAGGFMLMKQKKADSSETETGRKRRNRIPVRKQIRQIKKRRRKSSV